MVNMVDIYNDGEWIVPKSTCKMGESGRLEFRGCPGCETYHESTNRPLGCEMDDCDFYRIFEEYAELTGQYKSTRRCGGLEMNNMLNGMFGKAQPGMCRLSMSGGIAVKTENGYKSYNVRSGRLTNCDSFVFNIGEEFFFVIPTNKAEVGDIILQDHDGNITFEELSDGEYPKYYIYNYIEPEYLKHYKDGVSFSQKTFSKEKYAKVGIASDGLRYILQADEELKQEFINCLKSGKELKTKLFINRNHKIFKDDVTIVF